MNTSREKQSVHKEPVLENLFKKDVSSLKKYQDFFVGGSRLVSLLEFELINMLVGPMPGALGLLLRKWLYSRLFKSVGSGALWGRNITLRHVGNIEIGNRVVIDENCLLDGKGASDEGIRIGNDVLIARGTIIQGKTSWVKIGDRCVIGSQCQLWSTGGISLGKSVMLAGQCYIGGGRYRIDNREVPIMDQGIYSEGPVIIEDDVWLGAGVIVLDGIRIGKGCVVGAGTVVRENIPEYTVVTPHQKLVMFPRSKP